MLNRRRFIGGTGGFLVAPALIGTLARASTATDLPLTASSYRLDRTRALFDGSVQIKVAEATFMEGAIGDMNSAAFTGQGRNEITELGLHPIILAHANEGFRDYALLPIYLLHQFRHKSVFVRREAGISKPSDLRGRRIGTSGYSSSSLTWIRGIFEDEFGLKPNEMEWVVAAQDSSVGEAGKASAQENRLPEGVSITTGTPGKDESELLLSGEVDALFNAATPAAYLSGDPRISWLFPDFRTVEQGFFSRTGIFPIMHVLAIRRETAQEHPWLARAVFEAYSQAKTAAFRLQDRLNWATDMLPWYSQEVDNRRALIEANYSPTGWKPEKRRSRPCFAIRMIRGLRTGC